MQLREVPENPKSGRQPAGCEALGSEGLGENFSRELLSSCPAGLTDEEVTLAFQQSGTAADDPVSVGPATHVVPVQRPHLAAQPLSKSRRRQPALTLTGIWGSRGARCGEGARSKSRWRGGGGGFQEQTQVALQGRDSPSS